MTLSLTDMHSAMPSIHDGPGFKDSLQDVWRIWSSSFSKDKYLLILLKTAARLTQAQTSHLSAHPKRKAADLHRIIWKNISPTRFLDVYAAVLSELGCIMLVTNSVKNSPMAGMPSTSRDAAVLVRDLAHIFQTVGYSDTLRDMAAARAGNEVCSYWVDENCVADLSKQYSMAKNSPPVAMMVDQIERLVCPIISALNAAMGIHALSYTNDGLADSTKFNSYWKECARLRLASIRADQIYEIFLLEDKEAKVHLLTDLVDILSSPTGRAIVEKGLQSSFSKHLLHSKSRTVDVLDAFVLIIQTLTEGLPVAGCSVDESGVLLDRSARVFRRFLLHREDAARIVISSLLDPQPGQNGLPPASNDDFSGRISMAMFYHTNPHKAQKSYEGQNLTDFAWRPEPIDALSTHRINTEKDAIGHITSIQKDDIFIQELEAVLGKRLLDNDLASFHNEQRLLAMFRARFDEESGDRAKIQASDVMLFDMQRSLGWLETIKAGVARTLFGHPCLGTNYKAKVLSRSYWSTLGDYESQARDKLELPNMIKIFLTMYDVSFQAMTRDREVEWFHDLGKVTIEIHFRNAPTMTLEVSTVQATILNCFQDDKIETSTAEPTLADIREMTKLSDADARRGIRFWLDKGVLLNHPDFPDCYIVNEDGSGLDGDAVNDTQHESSMDVSHALEKTAQQRLEDHADTYMAYVDAMLRNLGAMPAGGILQTLSVLVPGGFAHDEEDLVRLLQYMETQGKVERSAGLWAYRGDPDEEEG